MKVSFLKEGTSFLSSVMLFCRGTCKWTSNRGGREVGRWCCWLWPAHRGVPPAICPRRTGLLGSYLSFRRYWHRLVLVKRKCKTTATYSAKPVFPSLYYLRLCCYTLSKMGRWSKMFLFADAVQENSLGIITESFFEIIVSMCSSS